MSNSDGLPFQSVHRFEGKWAPWCTVGDSVSSPAVPNPGLHICPAAPSGVCHCHSLMGAGSSLLACSPPAFSHLQKWMPVSQTLAEMEGSVRATGAPTSVCAQRASSATTVRQVRQAGQRRVAPGSAALLTLPNLAPLPQPVTRASPAPVGAEATACPAMAPTAAPAKSATQARTAKKVKALSSGTRT